MTDLLEALERIEDPLRIERRHRQAVEWVESIEAIMSAENEDED